MTATVTARCTAQRWRSLGTYVELTVADPVVEGQARQIAEELLTRLDRAASRFRPDSDLRRVNAGAGAWVRVDPFLVLAVDAALAAAEATNGLVNPLLGRTLVALGYDRSFDALTAPRLARSWVPVGVDAWREVGTDAEGAIRVPAGFALDLGSTAKAWVSDVIASSIVADTGAGVIVSVGGDIAVAAGAGAVGRWPVAISERPDDEPQVTVEVGPGGLATSSTQVRRWRADGVVLHHVVDPRTGRPASGPWRTVTATGPTCLSANTASTAAIVLGDAAVGWLAARGVDARLVDAAGRVSYTGNWPIPQGGRRV